MVEIWRLRIGPRIIAVRAPGHAARRRSRIAEGRLPRRVGRMRRRRPTPGRCRRRWRRKRLRGPSSPRLTSPGSSRALTAAHRRFPNALGGSRLQARAANMAERRRGRHQLSTARAGQVSAFLPRPCPLPCPLIVHEASLARKSIRLPYAHPTARSRRAASRVIIKRHRLHSPPSATPRRERKPGYHNILKPHGASENLV